MSMEELFETLYPTCRKCGLSIFDFWNFTYGEIIDFLNDFQERKELEQKEKLTYTYQLALLTSVFINRTNNGKQPPSINEVFPDIFPATQSAEDMAWMLQKEQMIDFALDHNRKGGYIE